MTAVAVSAIPTPALIVDHRILCHNLDEMAGLARARGVHLRPHAKTHRMVDAGRLQIAHGADGICVAKLGEAERFANAGIDDIFVAYPLVGQENARRALALDERVTLRLGTDSVDGARTTGEVFEAAGLTARLLLAIDTGLGREGVAPEDAVKVASKIAALDGVTLAGIYSHEGAVYGAVDTPDLIRRAEAAGTLMVGVAEAIRSAGIPLSEVSLGASVSARVVVQIPGITEIRPGIYAFNDVGQIALGTATLASTAIRVSTTVVSHPQPGRACVDAGSKALSGDLVLATAHRNEFPGHGLIVDHPGWLLSRVSEEHGWLEWVGEGPPIGLRVGEKLQIVPNHACMAFAMLRRAYVACDGRVIEQWEGFGPGSSE